MRFIEAPNTLLGMRAWCAHVSGYSFVISYEDGIHLRPGVDHSKWVGYTASFKSMSKHMEAVRIHGLWQSFAAAEKACHDTLKQLRQKQ